MMGGVEDGGGGRILKIPILALGIICFSEKIRGSG